MAEQGVPGEGPKQSAAEQALAALTAQHDVLEVDLGASKPPPTENLDFQETMAFERKLMQDLADGDDPLASPLQAMKREQDLELHAQRGIDSELLKEQDKENPAPMPCLGTDEPDPYEGELEASLEDHISQLRLEETSPKAK